MITNEVRAEIARAIAEARKTPVPLDVVMALAMPDKAKIMLADRPPGWRPSSHHVEIPMGYRAAISFEEQPAGLVRHLSISVDGKPGACPNVLAVMALAAEFGLPGGLEDWKIWTEEFDPGHFAVNLIAVVPA
jgi:hypothetical protein